MGRDAKGGVEKDVGTIFDIFCQKPPGSQWGTGQSERLTKTRGRVSFHQNASLHTAAAPAIRAAVKT